jgi:hypothetical protein
MSFQVQIARFRFSPDSGRIASSHRSATKSADVRRGAADGGELRQVAGRSDVAGTVDEVAPFFVRWASRLQLGRQRFCRIVFAGGKECVGAPNRLVGVNRMFGVVAHSFQFPGTLRGTMWTNSITIFGSKSRRRAAKVNAPAAALHRSSWRPRS